jgi:hypothetical protein
MEAVRNEVGMEGSVNRTTVGRSVCLCRGRGGGNCMRVIRDDTHSSGGLDQTFSVSLGTLGETLLLGSNPLVFARGLIFLVQELVVFYERCQRQSESEVDYHRSTRIDKSVFLLDRELRGETGCGEQRREPHWQKRSENSLRASLSSFSAAFSCFYADVSYQYIKERAHCSPSRPFPPSSRASPPASQPSSPPWRAPCMPSPPPCALGK